ncbi:putative enzyme [Candidatus Terasakiella magnetica]|uniref:Putative enzyme n=1 Tax=Candidatus Terasakiella magnetica TaxID=1867952 RepID=A0A1C3RIW9_9PROT|nr:SDR family oxidoreductase [Candidatus Terasakiella magnetica]SCA57194.1 putative enzyme [Candidatus Terasakiella magnetica]
MSSLKNKTILITGASSGLGEAMARKFAPLGANLVLGARRLDKLQSLRDELGQNCRAQSCDVTQEDDVQALAKLAMDEFGSIDVLINNAGVMPLSFFSEKKVEEWNRMIDVNIRGVLHGIAAVIDQMHEQKSGHIINIASVAGHVVTPTSGVYAATKFAVRAISEGLRQESRGYLRTTIISPGAVTSELTQSISNEKIAHGVGKLYEDAIDAEAIAKACLYAIEQPDDVDVNEIIVRPTKQQL